MNPLNRDLAQDRTGVNSHGRPDSRADPLARLQASSYLHGRAVPSQLDVAKDKCQALRYFGAFDPTSLVHCYVLGTVRKSSPHRHRDEPREHWCCSHSHSKPDSRSTLHIRFVIVATRNIKVD